jgi:transmembrane sensor
MSTDDTRIDEEAVDWLMRHETGMEDPHEGFGEWLERSPRHVARYLRLYATFRQLDGIDPDKQIEVDALAGNRLANVVHGAFGLVRRDATAARGAPARRRFPRLWPAAAAVAIAVAGASLVFNPFAAPTYATSVGEQRFVKLADGSSIHLNTRSRVRVQFSGSKRHVRLLAGEALFTVARDPARPFDVSDGRATFRALGTRFNLYKRTDGTRLTVTEGVVQVNPLLSAPDTGDLPRIGAGEQAEVVPSGQVIKTASPDPTRSVFWPQRTLVFRHAALPEVVAEFNRYNTIQLRLESERAGVRRISGIFGVDNPESLLRYLEKYAGVEVESVGDERVIRDRG